MKWLEMIQLRADSSNRCGLASGIKHLLDEITHDEKIVLAHERLLVETDFCIHIFHDSIEIQPHGSPIGKHLAYSLKAFGLVHHSVWSEILDEPF